MERRADSWFNNLDELKEANKVGFEKGVVIARDAGKREPFYKQFRFFPSVKEAAEFVKDANASLIGSPSYYEYIGVCNSKQRPWFDVDIPGDGKADPYEIVEELALVIVRKLKELTGEDLVVRIYETVYTNLEDVLAPPSKFSFHLVVDGVYFENHQEMANFGHLVKKQMQFGSTFVDPIWTEVRQMRLLGSSKRHKNAPKLFHSFYRNFYSNARFDDPNDRPLTYVSADDSANFDVLASMITNIEGCKSI